MSQPRTRRLVLGALGGGLCAVLVAAGVTYEGSGPPARVLGQTILATGTDACTTHNICISSTGISGGDLRPNGVSHGLAITFQNPLNVPVTVLELDVALTAGMTNPVGTCDATAFEVGSTSFNSASPPLAKILNPTMPSTGGPVPFSVPAASSSGLGSNTYNTTMTMNNSVHNQDSCQGLTMTLSYTATNQYSAQTQTALSAKSPAVWGQPTTLTANLTPATPVTPTAGHPGVPGDGTVIFYQCSTSACSPSPSLTTVGSGPVASGKASTSVTLTPSTVPTTDYFLAAYTPGSGDTDWVPSTTATETVFSLPVGYSSTISGNQSGLTVGFGQTVYVTSTGKVSGSATVQNGGVLYISGTVTGGLTIQPGGSVYLSSGTVTGGVKATSGFNTFSMCGASSVTGGLQLSSGTGPVTIGNPTSCRANSITGGLTLTSNAGKVIVGGNSITGGITCSGNSNIGDGGNQNKVSGPRSGQCTGTF